MIILDDYNRLFLKLPININFSMLYSEYRSFDTNINSSFCNTFSEYLKTLGDYYVITYTTGSDAIQSSIQWLLHYRLAQKIYYFRNVYHSAHFKFNSKNSELNILDWNPDDLESIIEAIRKIKNSAIIIEPIFSDYFIKTNETFFHSIEEICFENSNILIIDEIRTGLFSTGNFSYIEKMGIKPHIICFSKGLGLGVPTAVACWQKSMISKIDISELINNRTSQVTNSISLNLATYLIQIFKDEVFIEQIQLKIDKIKISCKKHLQNVKWYALGFIIKIELPLSASKKIRFFKELIDSKIFIRFPEYRNITLVFPFDSSFDDIDYVFLTISSLMVKYG